jgi:hypothetical protein
VLFSLSPSDAEARKIGPKASLLRSEPKLDISVPFHESPGHVLIFLFATGIVVYLAAGLPHILEALTLRLLVQFDVGFVRVSVCKASCDVSEVLIRQAIPTPHQGRRPVPASARVTASIVASHGAIVVADRQCCLDAWSPPTTLRLLCACSAMTSESMANRCPAHSCAPQRCVSGFMMYLLLPSALTRSSRTASSIETSD